MPPPTQPPPALNVWFQEIFLCVFTFSRSSIDCFAHQSLFTSLGECYCICGGGSSFYSFGAPEGAAQNLINCLKWCHLSQSSIGAEVWKRKRSVGAELERSDLTRPLQPAPHLCLRLAARSYSSYYKHNTTVSPTELPSCIVGNVGTRFWQGRSIYGIKKMIFLVLQHQFW